jgi:hypothetical protein
MALSASNGKLNIALCSGLTNRSPYNPRTGNGAGVSYFPKGLSVLTDLSPAASGKIKNVQNPDGIKVLSR